MDPNQKLLNYKSWTFLEILNWLGLMSLPIVVFIVLKKLLSLKSNTKEDLSSKVVLITGASSGLGEALAHAFCKKGCKVILAARRLEELKRVQSDLLNTKPNYEPVIVKLNLEDFNSIPAIINKILEDHGRIDILVNNGGVSVRGSALTTSIEVDIKIMNTNYLGTIALTKAILPSMIKQGEGRIVFISSVQGKFAIPHRSAYSASKHAIQAFTDSLRAEVHRDNVKVTCISPGYIKTSLSKNALTGDGSKHGQMDSTTNNGVEPEVMANNIISALLKNEKDVILAQNSAVLAYYLRNLFPSIYFWVMNKRAAKM